MTDQTDPQVDGSESSAAEDRRAVLAKLGLYGAVSAPILLGVLKAEKAVAQTVGIPG
jgi:hypothetical protein